MFALPVACTEGPQGPPPPTQREKEIAAETNSKVGDFVDEVMTSDAGSQTSCSVNIRVMGDQFDEADYQRIQAVGQGQQCDPTQRQSDGAATMTVTAGANGVWRLDNAPARFDIVRRILAR